MRLIRLCPICAAAALFASEARASVFTVTDTSDAGPGSLRVAITSANSNPGRDTIIFTIPGAGGHTITPASPLPLVTDPLVIDGYSQPGASPNTNGPGLGDNAVLLIELNGTHTSGGGGLVFYMGSRASVVRGLVVNRCPGNGIELSTNDGHNVIQGNFIGTNPAGTAVLANAGAGVNTETVSTNYNEPANQIGGSSPQDRNVISGNSTAGISLDGGDSSVVQGNFIGTNAAGTGALPGFQSGIKLVGSTSYNIIGGTTPGARNIISGNYNNGIGFSNVVGNPNITGNIVQGNCIGTDVTGTTAVPNGGHGIVVDALDNTIGGGAAGAGNVISGNLGSGIYVSTGSGCIIKGNRVGVGLSGTSPLGNQGRGGVEIAVSRVVVGGTLPGEGNIIAFNGGADAVGGGVVVEGGTGTSVLGNSIYRNTSTIAGRGLGIDLNADGVTLNTPCGPHGGPNHDQNFPVLTSASSGGGVTRVQGTLNTTHSTTFRVEVFADTTGNTTGYGDGWQYLGFTTVATDSGCNGSFTFTAPVTIPAGYVISATATDTGSNTSEFSHTITVVPGTGVTQESPGRHLEYALRQNFPNPFNPATTIGYDVPVQTHVMLRVYDVLGREVATLVNETKQPGSYTTQWVASGVSSGVYFYQLRAGSYVSTKRLLMLR